jgi:hypothetical protein
MDWTDLPITANNKTEQKLEPYIFEITDDLLMSMKLKDLVNNIVLPKKYQSLITSVEQELANVELGHVKPDYFIGDEWFCTTNSTSISIPYWLLTKKLTSITKKKLGHAEGSSTEEFKKLIRHEIAHCIDHGYKLSRTPTWQKTFGNPNTPYNPDHYHWNPKSKDFVINLPKGYAQSHPEEDYAETFAVWLKEPKKCFEKYRHSKIVIGKLEYIQSMARNIMNRPFNSKQKRLSQATRISKKLSEVLGQQSKNNGLTTPIN